MWILLAPFKAAHLILGMLLMAVSIVIDNVAMLIASFGAWNLNCTGWLTIKIRNKRGIITKPMDEEDEP